MQKLTELLTSGWCPWIWIRCFFYWCCWFVCSCGKNPFLFFIFVQNVGVCVREASACSRARRRANVLLIFVKKAGEVGGAPKQSPTLAQKVMGLFNVSREEAKVEKCIEWQRAACQCEVIMTSVQSQNNPRSEQQERTLPEALWWRGNNGCIPPLPPELWYQRAEQWFRQGLSQAPNHQPDHVSAVLLITPLPPGLTRMLWKPAPTRSDRHPRLFSAAARARPISWRTPRRAPPSSHEGSNYKAKRRSLKHAVVCHVSPLTCVNPWGGGTQQRERKGVNSV